MLYLFRREDHRDAVFSLFGVEGVSIEEKVDHVPVCIEVGNSVIRSKLPVFALGELDDFWVDANDRLPTEDGRFLVAVFDPDSSDVAVEIEEFENGDWRLRRSYRDKVLAWHELPKVFKEEK